MPKKKYINPAEEAKKVIAKATAKVEKPEKEKEGIMDKKFSVKDVLKGVGKLAVAGGALVGAFCLGKSTGSKDTGSETESEATTSTQETAAETYEDSPSEE